MVPEGWMINNKLYMITSKDTSSLEYICAFLNTKLFSKIILPSANFSGGKGADFLGFIYLPKPLNPVDFKAMDMEQIESYFAEILRLSDDEYNYIVSQ